MSKTKQLRMTYTYIIIYYCQLSIVINLFYVVSTTRNKRKIQLVFQTNFKSSV